MTFDLQPTLEGARIRVRPLAASDEADLFAIASDPLVWDQHPSKDRTRPEVFRKWFEDALACGGALVVIDRGDGRIIGSSRYASLDEQASEVEIGWTFLARSHWGGPTNSELKHLMLDHAFEVVETVRFRVHSENLRSRRAVEKLGAQRTGTEVDPGGRGENMVFRLARPSAP